MKKEDRDRIYEYTKLFKSIKKESDYKDAVAEQFGEEYLKEAEIVWEALDMHEDDISVEARELVVYGEKKPTLDEIILKINGNSYFHLEQIGNNVWWMMVGDHDGECIHCNLVARTSIKADWQSEGKVEVL
ncbi:MAG: hypothetical protein SV062_07385 [Thermodesulfobacteriota bacterium]|nr:hypothetical protein [Thermodesulfobacteriota bacterium]